MQRAGAGSGCGLGFGVFYVVVQYGSRGVTIRAHPRMGEGRLGVKGRSEKHKKNIKQYLIT